MLRAAAIKFLLLAQVCALTLVACGGGGNGNDGPGSGVTPPPVVPPPVVAPVVVDTTPPTVPTGLAATTPTSTQVFLSWNPSTDDNAGVAGYRVYRDGDSTPIANVTVTNYTDTGLASNSAYVYTVRAFDAASPANESALTAAVSVSTPPTPPIGDTTPPTVPETVTATAVSTTSIQISWTPSVDSSGIAEYRVFRQGSAVPIAVTQSTTFTDTQLTPNTTYTYYVAAVDGASPANVSAPSLSASATTGPGTGPGDITPPTVPGNVRADARSSVTIRLRWQRSRDASGIAEYRIYRDGGATPVATTDDNQYLDTNLAPNTTYQYTVTAVDRADPANESAHSEVASATTDNPGPGPGGDSTPPPAPENLVATARSSTEIDLIWSASADPSGIANYTVYRDGAATPIATVQTTSFTDSALAANSTHSYAVRATDNAAQPNTSAESVLASATTNADPGPAPDTTPPPAPLDLVATTRSSNEIELNWSASTDPSGIANYTVYRDGTPTPIATVQTTSYIDSALAPNSTHTYTVRATDNAPQPNTSADSAPASSTTDAPPLFDFTAPTVPQDVVAAAQSSSSIALSWSPSSDASGVAEYRIYRDGGDTPIASVTTPGFIDTGLAPATNYSYTVRAVDGALFPNLSAASDPATATTSP